MADPEVQIEFTEEELSQDYEPKDVDTKPVDDKPVDEKPDETKPEENEGDEKPDDVQDEGNVEQPKDNQPAPSDAELAAIYNVPIEDIQYAKNMGWSTKDRFKGDPKDWKDPKTFIDIAEQSTPILRDRLREISKKVTAMQEAFPTILEMQKRELQGRVDNLTEANARLEEELKEAHYLADSKKASELTEKIMENKLKRALTEEELKKFNEGKMSNPLSENVITPDNIDIEKERAWRDSVYPKLTLEQRERYNEAVRFIMDPTNADQTTDQRIAYIEGKVFGPRTMPAASPVARPSSVSVSSSYSSGKNNEYEVWDSMTQEEKDTAVSIIKELDWYKNKDTDPKAKAEWNNFKKSFRK